MKFPSYIRSALLDCLNDIVGSSDLLERAHETSLRRIRLPPPYNRDERRGHEAVHMHRDMVLNLLRRRQIRDHRVEPQLAKPEHDDRRPGQRCRPCALFAARCRGRRNGYGNTGCRPRYRGRRDVRTRTGEIGEGRSTSDDSRTHAGIRIDVGNEDEDGSM